MLRPFETVLVHPFRSKFMSNLWKNTKRSLMNSMNSESSATCDIRHPGIHMAWVGCGLALNVAELQAMQVTHASMLCKQQTFDNKSCNNYLSFTIFREGEISVLSSPCASGTAFHSWNLDELALISTDMSQMGFVTWSSMQKSWKNRFIDWFHIINRM